MNTSVIVVFYADSFVTGHIALYFAVQNDGAAVIGKHPAHLHLKAKLVQLLMTLHLYFFFYHKVGFPHFGQ